MSSWAGCDTGLTNELFDVVRAEADGFEVLGVGIDAREDIGIAGRLTRFA